MQQFMLMVRYDDVNWSLYSPEDYQKILLEFNTWREKLLEKDSLVTSGKLKDGEGKTLRMKDERIVIDGPYCETKEALGGFFLIKAKDYNEAVEVAKECPILPIGGSIEVRALELHYEE